jgi:predicted transcriptional regulator
MKKDKVAPEEILNKLFGSVTRSRILCLLYTFPGQSFYQREIMYQTGLSLRPVQRELNNLVWLGIVKKQTTRNRVYYGINPDSSFFKPLRAICGLSGEGNL